MLAVKNNELTREERVLLSTRVFGQYMTPMHLTEAKSKAQLIDIDCAMDNVKVPRYRDELSEQMKTIVNEETLTH